MVELQRMIRNQALLSGTLAKGPGLMHTSLDTLLVDVVTVESSSPHNLDIPWRGNRSGSLFHNCLLKSLSCPFVKCYIMALEIIHISSARGSLWIWLCGWVRASPTISTETSTITHENTRDIFHDMFDFQLPGVVFGQAGHSNRIDEQRIVHKRFLYRRGVCLQNSGGFFTPTIDGKDQVSRSEKLLS